MHRFFVSPSQIQQSVVTFAPDQARQMAKVLRLRPGDQVMALDNTGACHQVELSAVASASAMGIICSTGPAEGEPAVRLTLYQALLKGQKLDYVLQKGTELGIAAFALLACQRSVPRPKVERWDAKSARWHAVLKEAAEQSGRGKIPELHSPVPLDAACRQAEGLALLAYEGETMVSLREALATPGAVYNVSLFIGPEGGFTDQEVAMARRSGITTVTLGRRTLRAETAGIVAAAAIFYALGELDRPL